ncbi:acyltransferase family protein [Chitinophaga qingshengii]|uniref:Acyltransferase family protein n=1 Tax=Chitinophaga qingshengii TaxID=1569794 RepID=A0ABR7TH01_9BACT|nr:acyltransferase family protein [Chitinophaga qingshengii]MBC9928900.1 acyltransferase family protein [Chitinophaga qingshengii]
MNNSMDNRTSWIDNLRSFVTVLVVAHHSSLAYTTFAWFDKVAYIRSTHPVVDTARSRGLDIFEDFNDVFFMSLMFLISGIFVFRSLQQKGAGKFVRDRFYRLFIPFAIGVTVLMLAAYYPAYYIAHGKHDIPAYVADFFTVEAWPVGPPWFIWVLFAFNLVAAGIFPLLRPMMERGNSWLTGQQQHPGGVVLCWWLFTWILYVPMVLMTDAGKWTGIGPFDFQVSRVLLYFGYFLLGMLIGVRGLSNSLFADTSAFVQYWWCWLLAALGVYAALKCSEAPLVAMMAKHELSDIQANLIYRSIWVLSCTLSGIAFLTTFKRLLNYTGSWWQSLSANAYGIYLVHYVFVLWCQYALLDLPLPAWPKFLITFIVSWMLSWGLTAIVRKNHIIRKYL